MKTIFRYTNIWLLVAIVAAGAVAGFAQDPCGDAEGQTALGDKFRAQYPEKTVEGRKQAIETGKQFLDKYGACESAKDLAEYLKTTLPKMETALKNVQTAAEKQALTTRFDTALKAKNWDDVYASGQEILAKYPDEFRAAELVLGSIGLDETAKTPRVTKWNDQTLRYAKMSIADLESGKTFSKFGVDQFTYKTKDDALGWMNYTIGYITFFDKGNKKDALSYLYKATQLDSDTKSNPVVYQTIGLYYYDEVRKLAAEVDTMAKDQKDTDTPEVAKQKVDAIKAKVAMVNGTAEAAIDAYARAYTLAAKDPKTKPYADSLHKTIADLYNVRFGKPDGVDTWIANVTKKPMPNPLNPVTPIADPEPTGSSATKTPAGTSSALPAAAPAKPAAGVKPSPTAPAKPQVVTQPVAKKKS